jgi:hypothetical protein
LTGRRAVPISPDEKERFQALATAGLNGLSRSLAEKLNVDARIVEAFTTLDLAIWAKRPEVEEKRRELAKLYHPDGFPGLDEHTKKQNEQRLAGINAAATLLFNEHFGKSDGPSDP